MKKVSAILLGAGESKRMGFDKLSLPLGKMTVLERSLDVLVRSKVKEVIVVLGGRTKRMRRCLEGPKVKVIINPRYRKGMSTSIRQGLKLIGSDSRGILIALGDEPFVKRRTIDALIDTFLRRQGGIVVPFFRGRKGHPVIFDRKYEKELMGLRGDAGAKTILEKYPYDMVKVRTKCEGVVKDLDIWKDYRRLKVKHYKRESTKSERAERKEGVAEN
jgi:molybdenum cofactor cytidylyltransferase